MSSIVLQSPSSRGISVGRGGVLRGGQAGWVDPLANVPFMFRWQSHRGDGVPFGMYQDDAGTTPAGDEDAVGAIVDDFNGGTVGIRQSNAMKQGSVAMVGGVPVLRMDYVDDAYFGDAGTGLTMPYCLLVLCASSEDRAACRVINLSVIANIGGLPGLDVNCLIHPRRPTLTHFIDGTAATAAVTDGDFHSAAIGCESGEDAIATIDGSVTTSSSTPSKDWRQINLGAAGFYEEAAGADLIAVMAFPLEYQAEVEAYLETLKPA